MSTVTQLRRGLYWKEARQLVPLVAMLIGVALFVLVIWSLIGVNTAQALSWSGKYAVLVFPGLFAAGVGAILVGQEKENRTLMWNASLPIPSSEIIAGKFVIGLAGLVGMWAASLALLAMIPFEFSIASPDAWRSTHLIVWFTHSLYLLAASFYTAWRFQNAFVSLLVLVPISAIPFTIEQVIYLFRVGATGRMYFLDEETFLASLGVNLFMLVVMMGMAIRAAAIALGPTKAFTQSRALSPAIDAARSGAPSTMLAPPFRLSFTGLVWQSIRHQLGALGFLLLLVMFGFSALITFIREPSREESRFLSVAMVAVFLGISWLGVFAFTGDGASRRMRFLADRGVSPTVAWLARHAVVASVFACLLVLYGAFTLSIHSDNWPRGVMPSLATITILLWVVYGTSQWTSQVIRILAASFIIAPIFSGLALYWIGFSAIELDAPIAWLLLCSSIPLVTTWWMMRSHMDDRGPLRMWVAGVFSAILFIVLPMIPATIDIVSWRYAVSSSSTAKLRAATESIRYARVPESMMRKETSKEETWYDTESLTREELETRISGIALAPRDYLEVAIEPSDTTTPLAVDTGILESSLQLATLAYYQVKGSPQDAKARTLLVDWTGALTVICKRLRQSDRWIDQEAADAIEIWFVQILSEEPMIAMREQGAFDVSVAMLVDSKTRNDSRRRAVLASWMMYLDKIDMGVGGTRSFDGFDSTEWRSWMSATKQSFTQHSTKECIAATAIEMLDANASGQPTEAFRRQMHELVFGPKVQFESGPYSDRMRVDDVSQAYSVEQTIRYPANQWFAGWEEIPKQWKSASR